MDLSDITSAKTDIGPQKLFGPFHRLVIQPGHRRNPIVINMKVFSTRDLHALFEILGGKMIGKPRYKVFRAKKGRP